MRARSRARRRSPQGGFTLLELLITLVVTVFGMLGILAVHVASTRGNDTAGQSQEAVALGKQTLEYLRSKRTGDMVETLTGSPIASLPINVENHETRLGRNGVSYQIDVDVTEASPTLWRLRVEVSWTDDGSTTPRVLPLEVLKPTLESL